MQGFENEPIAATQSALAGAKESEAAKNPFDKTILLNVTVKMPGWTKRVATSAVECDTDKTLLSVSKKILQCAEYDAVRKRVSAMKAYLWNMVVPGVQFIKGGIYPIPTSRIDEVDARLKDHIDGYNAAVVKFLEVYEARRDECIERLRVLGTQADYPPVDVLKRQFGITFSYVTLGPPSSLQSINKDIWERESSKIKEMCKGAAEQVQDAMRGMFADLVAHMVERLTPGPDGKKKIFKDTLVGNFKEFITNFADRNICGDAELETLVQQAQNILAGKSVDALRKDDAVRASVTDGMTAIKALMDKMVSDRPNRAIAIEDDVSEDAAESA